MIEFNFSPFPVLETERLRLREISDADIDVFFKMRSDKNVMKYVSRPLAGSREDLLPLLAQIKNNVAANTDIAWAITYKHSPAMIGQIGFWRNEPENHRGEVGYMLLPEAAGKGIASEALNAVLKYGFEVMNFNSVKGGVDPENAASIRVLEKAGFVKEAHFREDYLHNGVFGDSAIYCLLKADRQQKHKPVSS